MRPENYLPIFQCQKHGWNYSSIWGHFCQVYNHRCFCFCLQQKSILDVKSGQVSMIGSFDFRQYKFFLSIMLYKMMPRFCWFNQWENWSFAVTQNPKLNCKLEVKKMLLGFDAYARWLPVVIITRKRKFVGGKYKTGSASFYGV